MGNIEDILKKKKTIAVVGLSPKAERDSHQVAAYLQFQGYRIIPVNPTVDEVLGEKSYPNLSSIPHPVDVVNLFRRSEEVLPLAKEAIDIGASVLWMQEGIINKEAAQKAREAGLEVVMDRCMLREHMRLAAEGKI